ncbi:putative acyl-CoA dehydrogenase [Stutzerimonas stutzeri]|nr:putative acyl-CoA dehydrogenase [Stutzerimonas stutzeri]
MDFKLTEEQQMLQDTAARLVRDAYPFEQREKFSESELGFSAEFWSQLGELGLTAVPFSEDIGGFGGSGVETMLVMTELGRGLTLEPYLQSVILAGGLINQLGSDAQKQDLLPQVAAGSLQLAVAFDEPQSHYNLNDVQTRAEAVDGGYRLSGRKAVVIGGTVPGRSSFPRARPATVATKRASACFSSIRTPRASAVASTRPSTGARAATCSSTTCRWVPRRCLASWVMPCPRCATSRAARSPRSAPMRWAVWMRPAS